MQITAVFLLVSISGFSTALQAQRLQITPNSYFHFVFFTPQLFSNKQQIREYNIHNVNVRKGVLFLSIWLCDLNYCDK